MRVETDFEVENFQEDVIEASATVPVLVDFWAPWCGPCHVLGPVLERLAGESGGAWRLAKVNTDQHPELSGTYGIRGIPAVKLFVDGEVVDEFTGALPEYAVKQWLEKALPSEIKQKIVAAEQAIAEGDRDGAESLLEEVLAAEPQNPKASVLLAQLIVFDEPDRARELVEGSAFAGPGYIQIGESVATVARLLGTSADDLPEGEVRADYAAAVAALRERDFESALERFIEVIGKDRYYDEDGARKACVALFTLLGNDHPAVKAYRRRFDMALY